MAQEERRWGHIGYWSPPRLASTFALNNDHRWYRNGFDVDFGFW